MEKTLRDQLEALWPEPSAFKQLAIDIFLEASEIERHFQAEALGQTPRMTFDHFAVAVRFFEDLESQREIELKHL